MRIAVPLSLTALTCLALSTACAPAADLLPGQVDFGAFTAPAGGGEFVEVNLPTSLISIGARFVEKAEPEVAKMLNAIKLVRVNVVGVDKENRADLEQRTQRLREKLPGQGWERIVAAQQKDQDVAIYLKTASNEAVQGLVVSVMDNNEHHAVFVNIVGDIKPDQIAMLGERLNIEQLKGLKGLKEHNSTEQKGQEKAEGKE